MWESGGGRIDVSKVLTICAKQFYYFQLARFEYKMYLIAFVNNNNCLFTENLNQFNSKI